MFFEGVRTKNPEATLLFVDWSKAFDYIHGVKNTVNTTRIWFPKGIFTAIMMLYKNMKAVICPQNGDTDVLEIVPWFLKELAFASYLFILFLDYILRTPIDLIKENTFSMKRQKADDISLPSRIIAPQTRASSMSMRPWARCKCK